MVLQDTVARAEARYRAGDYTAAVDLLSIARAASPTDPTILRVLGLCRLRLGDADGALELLRQAADAAPGDPMTGLHYAFALQAVGRHSEAIKLFRIAQTRLPLDPAPWLNLATSMLALGDAPGALHAARKARLRAPQMAETHYTVGLAHLAAGNLSAAHAGFMEATCLAPGFAEAWVNLGLICYRSDDLQGAVAAMRKALAIDPEHQAATINLAVFLRLQGNGDRSETLLEALLARNPDAVQARLNLADAMLGDGRPLAALALLEYKLPPSPVHRQLWHLQTALCLLTLGRITQARETLDALGPVDPAAQSMLLWRRVLLAVAEGEPAEAGALAEEMQAVLADDTASLPEQRIMGYFDLGRFWDRRGEAGRAFRCWQLGHDLVGRTQPFDTARFATFVDSSIAGFDRRRLRSRARAPNTDSRPVFIVGMPRSGTTLTEQILAAHRDIAASGERTALWETFASLGGSTDTPEAVKQIVQMDSRQLDRAARAYLDALQAPAQDAKRIVDKMPGNFRYLGLVALMLPGARIIHCERDARDTGLSIFTHRFYGMHPYAHDLADLGWYIAQQRRLMAHWYAVIPSRILTVRLRDWVEDFPATLRRVLTFLDLPYDPDCERFYNLERRVRTASRAQVREPIHARGLGRWRRYAEQLTPMIDALQAQGALSDETSQPVGCVPPRPSVLANIDTNRVALLRGIRGDGHVRHDNSG
jgi:tetratricopeptide (TPR) repeat protein